ncbi:unnamed protein product [Closterium sp. Naga37s-1]|nr:unnamed protein product [Closterium sp. Naga37s-1]
MDGRNRGTCRLKGAINATELVPATGTSCGYRVTDNGVTGNPYRGVQQYLNREYAENVKSAMLASPADAPYFASVAQYPTAVWLDTMKKVNNIQGHLDDAAAQAGGKSILVQFVIYDLPGRDCSAWSSNGDIPKGGLDTYKAKYIDAAVSRLRKKAANVRLSLVIEPDSLPNIAINLGRNRCDATTEQEYTEGVAYAIASFSQIPDTTLYLDSGSGGWLGWPDNMKRVVAVYKKVLARARQISAGAKIRGFASNVANYNPLFAYRCPASEKCPLVKNPSTGEINYDSNPCIDENRFTSRMNAYLGALGLPTRWIVDTSRSGRGGIRKRWGSWCNVKGAGIGQRPRANPGSAPQDGDVPAVKRATYQQRRADDAATSHPHWRRAGRGTATAAGSARAIATGSAEATGADSGAQPTHKPPRAPEGALKRRRGTEFGRMVADAKALGAAWGVPCIDSPEEAEAQCALLNASGVCDVVCTGDSDAFLFGAKAVVRDICLHKGANWAVLYTAADITASLSLGRNSLIAMGLFLGSDYSQGVSAAPTLRARQGAVQRVAALGEDGVLAAIRERGLAAISAPRARKRVGPGTGAQGKKGQQRRTGVRVGEGRGRGGVMGLSESGMSGCVGVGTGSISGAEGNPSAGEGGHAQGAREVEEEGEEQAREDGARVIEAFLNPPCHDAASDAVKSALQKHCSPSYADIVAFCDRHMAWPADVTARYIGSKLAERDLRRLLLVRQAAEICVTPGKEASRKADEVGGMLDGVTYRVGGIVKERWVAGHRMFEVSWTGQPEVENSVVRAELLTR